ncbi:MAG TPA: CHASE3 domain-containing protein [Acidobacteriaceae bacterium]
MRAFPRRLGVICGFILLLIVLIVNSLITRRQLGIQLEHQKWVVHTQQVRLDLSETESLLKDAETGQRGFLYTGDAKYLDPYNSAISQVQADLDELAQAMADNPQQQARVTVLRKLTHKKLDELAATISLYQAGRADEAKALVLSDAGLRIMDDIRRQITAMDREEESLEKARAEAYERSVRVTVACIYLASGFAAIGLILLAYYILRVMSLRERHGRMLEEREEWFRVTLTSLGDAVVATDQHGHVTFLNSIAETITGITLAQAQGQQVETIMPLSNESTRKPVANPVKKVMEEGRIVGLANHTVLERPDGTLVPIEDSAAPIWDDRGNMVGVVMVFRDATYERKTQDMLRRSEKLAAAGRLASTVAHEINNPLEAVGNLIYIARNSPGLPADAAENLALAEQELERVSHITRQTLGFYRESKVPEMVELPAIFEGVLRIYSNKFRAKNIEVETVFEECPPIQGLPGEMKQAMANLISNAADAVNPNGKIRVALRCVEESEGETIHIAVEDDGPGIAAVDKDRIFDPFFTTKKDVGTGLGLWVTKEIVTRHGGSIEARSQDASGLGGASFHVLLPCEPKPGHPPIDL